VEVGQTNYSSLKRDRENNIQVHGENAKKATSHVRNEPLFGIIP
jgi:hypothetical protein